MSTETNKSDSTTEETVVSKLMQRKYHISFAESCTAGMCAAKLVNVASASAVFDAGIITYANEAKVRYLNVSEKTIEQHGVVSENVAGEMAKGVAAAQKAEVGVGISGIAGPTGETETKPIGMVCFGFYINGLLITETKYFGNPGRNIVRALAAEYVFQRLDELL